MTKHAWKEPRIFSFEKAGTVGARTNDFDNPNNKND